MAREITSKHIDGITDLVVIAPIREGFIDAYENVTYATRARIVAEALHNVRVSAREYERLVPFSDTAERILSLLNYRIGILDKDLFQLGARNGRLGARRYLFLAVTFDGPWEPYMRLVWRPLGDFLDLLFCNCENYTPARDSSFEDYAKWVRSVQVDSAIFYSTTGLTVRDQRYLRDFERLQRSSEPAMGDRELARLIVPDPDAQAAADLAADRRHAFELALEALTVLYRLVDYYPPDRLDPKHPGPGEQPKVPGERCFAEGRYLLRAARSLLEEYDFKERARELGLTAEKWAKIEWMYGEQIAWFNDTTHLDSLEVKTSDPKPDDGEVQAGILNPIGTDERPVRTGALLMMTVTDAEKARAFLRSLTISYEGDPMPDDGIYCTIGFSVHGLRRIGLHEWKRKLFPKEFREGMERRAGLLGDYRENYPRSWKLAARNWPEPEVAPVPSEPPEPAPLPLPPVEMAEVDFIIQLRCAPKEGADGAALLHAKIQEISDKAKASEGAVLAAYEPMVSNRSTAHPSEETFDHFGFRDGISQPQIRPPRIPTPKGYDNKVARGEILRGYANDRGDSASQLFPDRSVERPPEELMLNGTFLVIRKLEQDVMGFEEYVAAESLRISEEYGIAFGPQDLKACLLGRRTDGTPLVATDPPGDLNAFDYRGDPRGNQCPLGSHIRRANPRSSFMERPTPRLMRRGMSFDRRKPDGSGPRGVIFMAYCASIAEQFETIQRWINGGNSTDQTASQNDPLLGVRPARGRQSYRFIHQGKVIRTVLPEKPFTDLHWGIYLFVPSRAAFDYFRARFVGGSREIDDPRETRGRALIGQIEKLPPDVRIAEWRRILEDFDTKDPAESDRSPDIWSAIRYYERGSYRIEHAQQFVWDAIHVGVPNPPPMPGDVGEKGPSVVLVGSQKQVCEVLREGEVFSVELQGERMGRTTGDIYVAMQPGQRYRDEAYATNQIMFAQDQKWGFDEAYPVASAVLALRTEEIKKRNEPFKIELRRDFIAPTLGKLCENWFGVPNGEFMRQGGWSWKPVGSRLAHCPGDFLAPSRNAFYPLPNESAQAYAALHGPAILDAGRKFVAKYAPGSKIPQGTIMPGTLATLMANAIRDAQIADPPDGKEGLLARNIIGMMIGMLPPIDGNLRGILYEWLNERTLWRHQAALLRKLGNDPMTYDAAEVLLGPVTRAMCKRPSPDFLYRLATQDYELGADDSKDNLLVKKGDIVIVSLVSAAQRSLAEPTIDKPDGDLSFVFGGERNGVDNGNGPFHACPAQKMMTGAIIGILAALLNIGRIKALPSSLIVEFSGWR